MALIPIGNPLLEEGVQFITAPIARTVTVAQSGGDFFSIQDALDSITDATAIKPYSIKVEPGTYGPITLKPYINIQAVYGTVSVVGTNQTAVTANFTGAEAAFIVGLNFINYSASDDSHAADTVGDANFDLCGFYLIPTGDYSGVAVKTSAATLQILGRCTIFTQPTGATTKNLDGIRCNGAGAMSLYLSSVAVQVSAASGDTCVIDENGTGQRNYDNLLLVYQNPNASFSGIAKGFCVSSKSAGQRLSQSSQVRLEGAGSGTAYAFSLDSTTNDAEYFHANSVVAISGFATEGVSFTGTGDVQRVWLSSPTKDLHKFGTGLSVITPLDKEETGFVEWGQEATYWTYATGTGVFTVDKSGIGCVHGAPMSWDAGQSETMVDRAVNYVYMDSEGTIGVTQSASGANSENVVLFEVWRQDANYIVSKENHPYKFTSAVSAAWHNLFGSLLQDASQTLAINTAATRTIDLVGSNTLTDHGLDSTIDAQTPIVFQQMVEGVSGAMVQVASSSSILSVKSNGTDTGVNVANNRFVVYRLGVVKESLNSATPTFISICDDEDFGNLPAANTQITSGLVRPFPVEARRLEICQLGYAIVQANGAGAGTLSQVTTALQVFGAQFVAGGTSTSASLITLDTTNFDGELSSTETNMQIALSRLDDYDSILPWAAKDYRVGNIVRVTDSGPEGIWRCNTAHTGSAFGSQFAQGYWDLICSHIGSRESISLAGHGFTVGDALYHNGTIYAKAQANAAATANVIGFVAYQSTNYFILARDGRIPGLSGTTASTAYYLSATTAGGRSDTPPTTSGHYIVPIGATNAAGTLSIVIGPKQLVGSLSADTITETTSGSGVTIDSVLLKDNSVTATGVTATTITATGSVVTDTILERTGAAGVSIDGVLNKDGAVTATGGVFADTITESTLNAGVTVESVLIKDGAIEEVVRMQFEQATGTPSTPASSETLLYAKNDGLMYTLNSDGVETPIGNGNTIDRITQNSHGFAVGNLVYLNGSTYTVANASGATTAEVAGMVYRYIGANEFELTTCGEVNGIAASGFAAGTIPAAGTVCFLNSATGTGAGLLTTTEPTVAGQISKPVAVVKASGTAADVYFFNMRGSTVGGTNLYSGDIALNNAATTTFHTINCDVGSGGWLSGTVKIDATTDYAIPFFCFFSRPATGTYNVAAQFGDDVPPAASGVSFAITNSGSSVQVVMPSVTGFSSASVNYCVQAAANGTQLPVNVDSNSISWREPTMFRNRIKNGSTAIDQRNGGVEQTFTAAAALAYSIDRFYGYCTGANVTGQRVAGTLSQYMYQFTGAASVTKIGFAQRIESVDCLDLAGTNATLAVDLSNSLLTTVTWTAWYANTADTFGTLASQTRTQIATGTFTVTSTNTRYSTTIAIPAAATTGIEIEFSVGAQTSGTFKIGRVQLEPGSIATPFEFRPYGTELALCERYLERLFEANKDTAIPLSPISSVSAYGDFRLRQTKRTTPTLLTTGSGTIGRMVGYNSSFVLDLQTVSAVSMFASGTGPDRVTLAFTSTYSGTNPFLSFDTIGYTVSAFAESEL